MPSDTELRVSESLKQRQQLAVYMKCLRMRPRKEDDLFLALKA